MSFTALVKSKVILLKLFAFLVFYLLFFFTLGFLKTNIVKAKSISGVTPGAFVSQNFRIEPTKEVTSNTVNLCLYAPEDNIIHTAGGIQDRLADSNEDNLVGKLLNNFVQTESKKLSSTLFVKTPDGTIPMNRAIIQDTTDGKYNYLTKHIKTNAKNSSKNTEALFSKLIPDAKAGPYVDSTGTKREYSAKDDTCLTEPEWNAGTCIKEKKTCLIPSSPFGPQFCTTECEQYDVKRAEYLACLNMKCATVNRAAPICHATINDTYLSLLDQDCEYTYPVKINDSLTVRCPVTPESECNIPKLQQCAEIVAKASASSAQDSLTAECIDLTKDTEGNPSPNCFPENPNDLASVKNEIKNAIQKQTQAELIEAERQKCKTAGLPDKICDDPATVQKILEGHSAKVQEAQSAFDDLRKECYAISGGDDACDSSNPVVVGNTTYAYKKANEEAEFRKDCLAAGIPVSICSAPRSEIFAKAKTLQENQGTEDAFASILVNSCLDKVKALTAKGYGFDPASCNQLTPELIQTVIDTLPDANAITTSLSSIGDCSRIGEGWYFDEGVGICLPPTFIDHSASSEECIQTHGPGWSFREDLKRCTPDDSTIKGYLGIGYAIGNEFINTIPQEILDPEFVEGIVRDNCRKLFDPSYVSCNEPDLKKLIEINADRFRQLQQSGGAIPDEITALLPSEESGVPSIVPNPKSITSLPIDIDPKRIPPGKIKDLCENQSVACTAYLQPLNTRSDSIQDQTLRYTSAQELADNLSRTGNGVDRIEVSPDGKIEVVRYYFEGKPLSEYVYSEGQLVQVNGYYKDEGDHTVRSIVRYDAEECGGDGCRNYYVEALDENGNILTSTTINEKANGKVEVLTHNNKDQIEFQAFDNREDLDADLADALGISNEPIDLTKPNALDIEDALEGSLFGGGEITGGGEEFIEPTGGDGNPDYPLEKISSDYENTNPQGFNCWDYDSQTYDLSYVVYDTNDCPAKPESTEPQDEETMSVEPELETLPDSETEDSDYKVAPDYILDDTVLGVKTSNRVVPSGKSGGVFCDMPLSEKIAKIEIENLDGGGSPKIFIEDPLALYDYSREGLAWQVAPLKANENQAERNIKVTFYVRNNPKDKNLQTYSTNLTITLKKEGFIQSKISNPGSFLNNLRKLLPI